MAETTGIQWTDSTFNPWRGALGTRVVAAESYWRQPLKWNREAEASGVRHRVFCASLADVFEEWDGPMLGASGDTLRMDRYSDKERDLTMDDVRRRLFELIDQTPWLDYLLLTKRPENIRRMWPDSDMRNNVWLGVSAGTQLTADKVIPELMRCSDLSPVRFVSAEPLLEETILPLDVCGGCGSLMYFRRGDDRHCNCGAHIRQRMINWVICGCESGPRRRHAHQEWFDSIRDQCSSAGVAFFNKQMEVNQRVEHDIRLFPERLQIREFPFTKAISGK